VGGRVWTIREPFADGRHAEGGGEFIDTGHVTIRRYVRRFGLALEDTRGGPDLEGVIYRRGRRLEESEAVTAAVSAELARVQAREGVEAYRIRGGNDQLPKALAASLPTVVRGEPVIAVVQSDNSVQVASDGLRVSGDYAVLAMPFPAMRRIRFTPALPRALAT